MASSLFGKGAGVPAGGGINPLQFLQQFKKFTSSGITAKDAQSQVQQLIDSGRMSQEQFNDLQNKAKQLSQFFGKCK